MGDIAPRPWRLSEWFCADVCAGDEAGTFLLRGLHATGRTGLDVNSRHAVNCVNAIHAAGLTPEALAVDPECVKKLVAVARAAAVDWSWQRSENHPMYQEHNCDRGRNPKDGEEPREECPGCYRFSMAKWSEDILHACGIKT